MSTIAAGSAARAIGTPGMIEDVSDDLDLRLEEIQARHDRVSAEMAEPGVATDPERFRSLGKAFSELQEIVVPYRAYREARRQATDARGAGRARE